MMVARRILEALVHGLLVALLAPPVAGIGWLVLSAAASTLAQRPVEWAQDGVVLLVLGVVSASYFLGAGPAFVAGLSLPAARKWLKPGPAAVACGLVGVGVYALSLGAHLLAGPNPSQAVLFNLVPAFIGVALAAWLAGPILGRAAEA